MLIAMKERAVNTEKESKCNRVDKTKQNKTKTLSVIVMTSAEQNNVLPSLCSLENCLHEKDKRVP